jgi:replicative DNA helicase
VSKGDLSDAVRSNRKAVREQIKQAAEAEPPDGKNGDTAPIYEEVDLDRLMQEDGEPVPEFPLDTLPDRFRNLVEEVMRHYRVPALLPAVCALLTNSSALGRGVYAKSNSRRTFPNLYALIGAKSGTGKSVVFDECVSPLSEMQQEAIKAFGAEQKPRAEVEMKLLDREIHELAKFKKNERKFDMSEDCRQEKLSELLQQKAELEDKLQFAARLYCEDFTSEALGMLLAASGEQISVLSDEGGLALYNMLGRYTKGDITDDILLCRGKTCNSHTVDRVGRPPIFLRCPCITLLLLVQPDLLERAFSNERLMVGGFLARCLTVDSQMQVQYQTEHSLPDVEENIKAEWDAHNRQLVEAFRYAEEPYQIPVEPEVRKLSRQYSNDIVDQVRGTLADVTSFAIRWDENAWGIAENLHMGLYGAEWLDKPTPLSAETFKKAITISRYFADRQLEVLQRPRIEAQEKLHSRLEEVFEKNENKPITIRTLRDRHGIKKGEVLSSVKSHPDTFGIITVDPPHGGSKSVLVFLKSNPPPGWRSKK